MCQAYGIVQQIGNTREPQQQAAVLDPPPKNFTHLKQLIYFIEFLFISFVCFLGNFCWLSLFCQRNSTGI